MNMNQWWVTGIVLVILVIGGYWYLDRAYATTLVTNDNAVLLESQKPSDDMVVTYAKLAKPGYVVIYTSSTSTPKTVAGQSDLLTAGEHRNVHIHTNGTLTAGATITAAVVADDGNGTYDDSDTEVLAGDDAAASAELSDTAVLDETPSDADLAAKLDDAGYDLSDSAQAAADAMMHEDASSTDDAMMHDDTMASTTMEQGSMQEENTESNGEGMMEGDANQSQDNAMMHEDSGAMMNEEAH
ncbi:MAG TPA: hypothetical protein VHC20_02135 [Candidatus Paceibacterota bacterium]|nr:hypothetical protein [Candidatus Paceibacterota bacterium]